MYSKLPPRSKIERQFQLENRPKLTDIMLNMVVLYLPSASDAAPRALSVIAVRDPPAIMREIYQSPACIYMAVTTVRDPPAYDCTAAHPDVG